MVCIIVNEFAYRLRTSGVIESSRVAFEDETLTKMKVLNDWQERSAEMTDLSGYEQSVIYGSLLQLSPSLPKFGEKQPHREWVKPIATNVQAPMK